LTILICREKRLTLRRYLQQEKWAQETKKAAGDRAPTALH